MSDNDATASGTSPDQPFDKSNKKMTIPTSTRLIGASQALAYFSRREADFRNILQDFEYDGRYAVCASFNENRLRSTHGRLQELCIFLEKDIVRYRYDSEDGRGALTTRSREEQTNSVILTSTESSPWSLETSSSLLISLNDLLFPVPTTIITPRRTFEVPVMQPGHLHSVPEWELTSKLAELGMFHKDELFASSAPAASLYSYHHLGHHFHIEEPHQKVLGGERVSLRHRHGNQNAGRCEAEASQERKVWTPIHKAERRGADDGAESIASVMTETEAMRSSRSTTICHNLAISFRSALNWSSNGKANESANTSSGSDALKRGFAFTVNGQLKIKVEGKTVPPQRASSLSLHQVMKPDCDSTPPLSDVAGERQKFRCRAPCCTTIAIEFDSLAFSAHSHTVSSTHISDRCPFATRCKVPYFLSAIQIQITAQRRGKGKVRMPIVSFSPHSVSPESKVGLAKQRKPEFDRPGTGVRSLFGPSASEGQKHEKKIVEGDHRWCVVPFPIDWNLQRDGEQETKSVVSEDASHSDRLSAEATTTTTMAWKYSIDDQSHPESEDGLRGQLSPRATFALIVPTASASSAVSAGPLPSIEVKISSIWSCNNHMNGAEQNTYSHFSLPRVADSNDDEPVRSLPKTAHRSRTQHDFLPPSGAAAYVNLVHQSVFSVDLNKAASRVEASGGVREIERMMFSDIPLERALEGRVVRHKVKNEEERSSHCLVL